MNNDKDKDLDENYSPRHGKIVLENIENKNNQEITGSWEIPKNAYIQPKKKGSILSFIVIMIFLCTTCFSAYKIALWLIDNKKTSDSIKNIENNVEVKEIEDNNNTEIISKEDDKDNPYWYYITFPLIDVDINKLRSENSDTVGWINVNNTNINYPFVQTNNNDYYLNHSFNKDYNEAGWIFLDYRNNNSFSSKNNIIYGHSRLDKSMFGTLNKVLKPEWYSNKDNHIIRISLENENTLWQIFSVYKIKEESYYITTDFTTTDSYLDFLKTIQERSLYNFNTNLNESDKILTLSTCYSDTERTVIHARLIKRETK